MYVVDYWYSHLGCLNKLRYQRGIGRGMAKDDNALDHIATVKITIYKKPHGREHDAMQD
jgi:hypothetical protein